MRAFSEAIEQALNESFKVSNSLIAYEALLRMLFSTSPATGLCLYDRRRMPLQVVNGALLTAPDR